MPVAHILNVKGRHVHTATRRQHVEDVAKLLTQHKIGAVVIVEGTKPIGIVSERDIVRFIAEAGTAALAKPVDAIMSHDIKFCREGDSEEQLMELMTENRIRHLPVLNGDKLAGMISIGDVVKFRMETIVREAEDMRHYIQAAG